MSRPTRTHSTRLLSGLSLAFFIFLAVIFLCPPAVSAEDKKSEYGTVIGIGNHAFSFLSFSFF
jgi:heat shock protein 5